MGNLDLILSAAATVMAAVSLIVNIRRRGASRIQQLRELAEESLDTAVVNCKDGQLLERVALEMAILHDLRDGKRDFTREQLWGAVEAAMARRGLKGPK